MHVVRTVVASLFVVNCMLNNNTTHWKAMTQQKFYLLSFRAKNQQGEQYNRSWSAGPKKLQTVGHAKFVLL